MGEWVAPISAYDLNIDRLDLPNIDIEATFAYSTARVRREDGSGRCLSLDLSHVSYA
jgi:hypothetical protein